MDRVGKKINPCKKMPRCPDAQTPRRPDVQMPRCPDAQMPRFPDALMPRSPGAQMPKIPLTWFLELFSLTSHNSNRDILYNKITKMYANMFNFDFDFLGTKKAPSSATKKFLISYLFAYQFTDKFWQIEELECFLMCKKIYCSWKSVHFSLHCTLPNLY